VYFHDAKVGLARPNEEGLHRLSIGLGARGFHSCPKHHLAEENRCQNDWI